MRGGYASTPGVGAQALSLTPGSVSQAELISRIDRGLLVQDVSGLHSGVNPVSGDFSTGAEGLMIRGGALAEPVREFTIASTLQKMLHDAVAVGNDQEWLPMNAAGVTLVVDGTSHELEPGDSAVFDADLPHRFENAGLAPATFLSVVCAGLRRS